jgi:D-alanine-D-alanine ligase
MTSPFHIAVLMGGWSSEREVSLKTGEACARALEGEGYHVTRIDVKPDLAQKLQEIRPDVAFNALHGRYGEDGTVQGLLEILGIPYTHSGVLASALAMDKAQARIVMQASGVPVAAGQMMSRFEVAHQTRIPAPYVIKPVREGSSVGVIVVHEGEHVPDSFLAETWSYGDEVLVERYVPGLELTCAVMGETALDVIDIRPAQHSFYDFEAKYAEGGSIHILPAKLKPNLYRKVQECAVMAHKALGCRGVSRADLRYDEETDTLVVLEVNTQPGMTQTSLVPELAAHAGYSFGGLVRWIIEDASLNR